jgi:hypothetical protein
MNCHEASTALLESRTSQPGPELARHLETCADCRALAALHASASALKLPSPPALAPVSREAVLGTVRRRRVRRRAAAGVGASLALGALVLGWPSGEPPAPLYNDTEPAPLAELGLRRAPDAFQEAVAEPEAGQGSLFELMGEVRGYTRRDLVVHDETYRPFGLLAAWVRPPESRALESPPFRTAVLPLYFQESMP